MKNQIEKNGFIENQDFEVFDNFIKNPNGGNDKSQFDENIDFQSFNKIIEREIGATQRIEYALSIDCAKEILW